MVIDMCHSLLGVFHECGCSTVPLPCTPGAISIPCPKMRPADIFTTNQMPPRNKVTLGRHCYVHPVTLKNRHAEGAGPHQAAPDFQAGISLPRNKLPNSTRTQAEGERGMLPSSFIKTCCDILSRNGLAWLLCLQAGSEVFL